MLFLVKMRQNQEDIMPKLMSYVTSISKTIQKIQEAREVRFQDELSISSNITVQNQCTSYDFHIKSSIFHKEFGGLLVNLAEQKQGDSYESGGKNKKTVLFFLPRTLLFNRKDINVTGYQFQDLHIQSNFSLVNKQNKPCFISFFEEQYHVFLAEDLINSKDKDPVFENKNKFSLKEKVSMRINNTMDFKINNQQGYCSMVNMRQEIFERPYITFNYKAASIKAKAVVLDKFQILNLNPYVVVVQDQSIINIYSYIEPGRHYVYKIEDQFLQYVDIAKGSIQLGGEKYYRHQVCMFLTLTERGKVKINLIIMPSYSDNQDENKIFKLNVLPYSIDWLSKYKYHEIIYKAFFVQYPSKDDSNLSLILQIKEKVIVFNLSINQSISFPTQSSVPMLQQHLDDAIPDDPQRELQDPKSLFFFIHSIKGSHQVISQIEIAPNQLPSFTNIYEFNGPIMIRMQQILGNTLITLNDQIQIKMFKLQSKTLKLKLRGDYRLIDEARKLINNPDSVASATIEMTREAVYINHQFYQILKKSTTKYELTDFEIQREKCADSNLSQLNFCLGPYLSIDKQNLVYVFRSNTQISDIAKQDENHLTRITDDQNALMTNLGKKIRRALQWKIKRFIMKPDESTYKIVQVPLLMSNQMSLLHRDDFYRENVEISTFTPENDIILKLQDKFLAFDKHGNQLTVKVDKDVQGEGILQNYKLLQCQIVEQELGLHFNDNVSHESCRFLGFVFEQAATNKVCVIQVRKSDELGYTLSFWKWKVPQNIIIIRQESLEDPFFQVRLRMTHLESDGNLYQLLIFQVQERHRMMDDFSFVKYPERQDEDREESFVGLNTKIARLFQQKSKHVLKMPSDSNNSVRSSVSVSAQNSITEVLLNPGKQEEEQSLDYDFQLLQPLYDSNKQTIISQYFVLKRDLNLHFFDIKDIGAIRDPNRHLERVSLDLDNGEITQILATSQPNIVQFVFTQAKPLQHYVFNWDLKRNMEVQMHAYTPSQSIPYVNVIRGVTARENYFVPLTEKHIYDLRFQYPMNFFNGSEANKGHDKIDFQEKVFKKDFSNYHKFLAGKCDENKHEYKVAGNSCALLGISKPRVTTLQYPFNYISLQYVQYIVDVYKENEQRSDEKQKIKPILDLLKVNLQQETNILHVFALDQGFLRAIAKEIRHQMNDFGDKDALSFVYYALLPRNISTKSGMRPLSIALNQNSPKCLEIMLDMLKLDKNQDYMRYVERYLLQLLQMKSPVFFKFLDTCCQKFQFRMQGTLKIQTMFLYEQSQYINQKNFIRTFHTQVAENPGSFRKNVCCFFTRRNATSEQENHPKQTRENQVKRKSLQDRQQSGQINQNDMKSHQIRETNGSEYDERAEAPCHKPQAYQYDKNEETLSEESENDEPMIRSLSNEKKAQINFYSYEFDRILKGKNGQQLINYISSQPVNSPLFQSKTVQAYLDSQWQHFKWKYYMIVIFYILSFVILFFYFEMRENTFIAPGDKNSEQNQQNNTNKDNENNDPKDEGLKSIMNRHYLFYYILLPVQFALSIFLTAYETRKMIATKDKWQLFIVVYNSWQIVMPFFDHAIYFYRQSYRQSKELKPFMIFVYLYLLIYGVFANFLIIGLLVLFYKIKYLNFASFFITRMFLIISDIIPLTLIILGTEIIFAYSYKIIDHIYTGGEESFGNTIIKAFKFFYENTFEDLSEQQKQIKSTEGIDQIIIEFVFVFQVILALIVIGTHILMIYFLIAAIIESYNKVSQNLKSYEYLSRSKILFENSFFFTQNKTFKHTRYIIKAQAESIADQDSNDHQNNLSTAINAGVRSTIENESLKNQANFKLIEDKLTTKISSIQQSNRIIQEQQVELREQIVKTMGFMSGLMRIVSGGGDLSAQMKGQLDQDKCISQ